MAVSTACGFRSSGLIVTRCSTGVDSTPFSSTTMSWKTWSPGSTGFVTEASTVTVASDVTTGAPTTNWLGSTRVMSSSEGRATFSLELLRLHAIGSPDGIDQSLRRELTERRLQRAQPKQETTPPL